MTQLQIPEGLNPQLHSYKNFKPRSHML